jgi:hypothetical protein
MEVSIETYMGYITEIYILGGKKNAGNCGFTSGGLVELELGCGASAKFSGNTLSAGRSLSLTL